MIHRAYKKINDKVHALGILLNAAHERNDNSRATEILHKLFATKEIRNMIWKMIEEDKMIQEQLPNLMPDHLIKDVANAKCICELNAEGAQISGWCSKHHTDFI